MQTMYTFLMFQGDAEEALRIYAAAFPGMKSSITSRYGESDGEFAGRLRTAEVLLNGQQLMFFDSNVKHDFTFTPAMTFYITCRNADEIDAIFAKLSCGGRIFMPLGEYPFSKRYVWFSDKFGVSWQVGLK